MNSTNIATTCPRQQNSVEAQSAARLFWPSAEQHDEAKPIAALLVFRDPQCFGGEGAGLVRCASVTTVFLGVVQRVPAPRARAHCASWGSPCGSDSR